MKQLLLPRFLLVSGFFILSAHCFAQLQVTQSSNAQALAQKLVGNGVIVQNAVVTQTATAVPTGFFNNIGGTNINIDSGIVITNGRAKSNFATNQIGVDGNGTFPASDIVHRATTSLGLPGDIDLANAVGTSVNNLHDAVTLEFDVIPLGDTIQFRYIISSEEYTPSTVCTFNDAFALLLSGPGITGQKNLALVPGTNVPVTITNVNNVPGVNCNNNTQYYVSNTTNVWFTHDGHTKVFTARSDVQPCQVYHLKFVVADRQDFIWDTGVFIEAASLTSDPIHIDNQTPLNQYGLPFVAEGCHTSEIHICRSARKPYPQPVSLTFAGNATNGVDLQLVSSTYTIAANDSFVVVPIVPLADFVPEGNEHFRIYVSNPGCGSSSFYTDSIDIEIRDVNMMLIDPGDSATMCTNSPLQLIAEPSYLVYSWSGAGLSNYTIYNPLASPVSPVTNYICTATIGNCVAQDSILVKLKNISLLNKTDVWCHNGTNGQITVTGQNWDASVQYSINDGPWQPSPTFINLPVGVYKIKMKDAVCTDSIFVTLVQAFPDLNFTTATTPAGCSVTPDGVISVSATGGNSNYLYSIDGLNYQPQNFFNVFEGNYTVYVKDGNQCLEQQPATVLRVNTINLNAGADTIICLGRTLTIPATSNAASYSWSPAASLSNPNILAPVASPSSNTLYIVVATDGRCTKADSILVAVRPSPIANAGNDTAICTGGTVQLHGSGGISYQWSPGIYFLTATNISDPVVAPKQTTSYFLTITNSFQCTSLVPDEVKIIVTPPVKMFAGKDTIVAMGQPLQLFATELNSAGVTIFNWSPTSNLNNPNIANPVAILNSNATYTITGITPDGCLGTDDIYIKVYKGPEIYVPGAFTPNADGKNDLLHALPIGMKEFHYFRVYDRWGQLVFSTQDPHRGWDGKVNGMDQPTVTFVWIAEAIDFNGHLVSRKGTVTIIR